MNTTEITALNDDYGFSLLHYAAHASRVDLVKLLLERGADVNDNFNADYVTPLELSYLYRGDGVVDVEVLSCTTKTTHRRRQRASRRGGSRPCSYLRLDDLVAYLRDQGLSPCASLPPSSSLRSARNEKRWNRVVKHLAVVSFICTLTQVMLDIFTREEDAETKLASVEAEKALSLSECSAADKPRKAEKEAERHESEAANRSNVQRHATETRTNRWRKKGEAHAAHVRAEAEEAARVAVEAPPSDRVQAKLTADSTAALDGDDDLFAVAEAHEIFRLVSGADAMMNKEELVKAQGGDFGLFSTPDCDRPYS